MPSARRASPCSWGWGLIFLTGFAYPEVIHNAAHDTRHSLSFPCHDAAMLTRILSVGLLAGLLAGLDRPCSRSPRRRSSSRPRPSRSRRLLQLRPRRRIAMRLARLTITARAGNRPMACRAFFFTAITTIATAVGVAFVLMAVMVFAGAPIDEHHALAWAIAGFVACGLAPAAGLAPELPGGAAGDLVAASSGGSARPSRRPSDCGLSCAPIIIRWCVSAQLSCCWRRISSGRRIRMHSRARCRPKSPRASPRCRWWCRLCSGPW